MGSTTEPAAGSSGVARPSAAPPLTVQYTEARTPIGSLGLFGTAQGLLAVALPATPREAVIGRIERVVGLVTVTLDDTIHQAALRQLAEYFAGERRAFDLPLDLRGTPFQLAVWAAVAAVPYGATRTYGAIARVIGRPDAIRAVGGANGANPLPPIIPCHRLVGAHGQLTGYAGGLASKRQLLALEEGVIGSSGRRAG